MIIEKKIFTGGMDGDTMLQLLAQDNYLNLMNARIGVSQYGRNYRIENFPGTSAISQSVYPPYGTNQCLGSCADIKRNRIFYAMWNSVGYHAIYCRDLNASTTYAVLYDSQVIGGLNFSKSYRIDKNMYIVGDLLYWSDNNNQPRRINAEAAIKMNHPSYVTNVSAYSWPMTQSVISWIRRPFGLGITATKLTDGTVAENFLKDFAGQFSSRLVYRDGEISVTSTPSNMVNYNYSTDTTNAIDAVFDINEDIDQDVNEVQLLVRYDNDPSYFIIRKWNKDIPADAAAITAHNSGITPLTYRFLNDKLGEAISDVASVKPEDPVPLVAKTIAFALNRAYMANYTRGYNTPTQTSLQIDTFSTSSADPDNVSCFKAFSSYQIAIRFRDEFGRKSSIATNDNCIFSIADRNADITSYITSVSWILSNAFATDEIPEWAYYYDILMTKNLRTRYFISGRSITTQYALKNTDGTYTYQNIYTGNAYGISLSPLFLDGVGYLFNEGDMCRVYISGSSTVRELPVLGNDGGNILIQLADIGNLNTQPSLTFEIYTPYKKATNETFYTTGNSYVISNPGTISRTYSTITGNIGGDVYRQKQSIAIFVSLAIVTRNETMSPNNLVNTLAWFNVFGQSGIQSSFGQAVKPNFIMYSNTRIPGSKTNGLSSFDALDEKPMPETMGSISKLQLASKVQEEGTIMLAIGEKETASLYLGEVQVVGASKNAFLAQQDGVIGTINILRGNYGTTMPSSVTEYLGMVFWYDILNGYFVQYSLAGLEPVSRFGQLRFFKNYAKDYNLTSQANIESINGFSHIPGYVDPFHSEVGVATPALIYENYANVLPSYSVVPSYASSIIDRFDIYDKLGKMMAYKFTENKWGSNFEGIGEEYNYIQDRMFSWKNGVMYEHNVNTTQWNTVYGVQYPVRYCFVANLNGSLLKVLNNIAVEGSVIPDFTVAMAKVPNTQLTDLAATDDVWENQEGNMYAVFMSDRLSPNASGTPEERLFTGDPITDTAILVMLEFQQYNNLIYINFVDVGYSAARGQKIIANPSNV